MLIINYLAELIILHTVLINVQINIMLLIPFVKIVLITAKLALILKLVLPVKMDIYSKMEHVLNHAVTITMDNHLLVLVNNVLLNVLYVLKIQIQHLLEILNVLNAIKILP